MDADRRQLVDDIFDAFSHRELPRHGYGTDQEADVVKAHLEGITPRRLSFELLDSCPEDEREFLTSMKPPMQLYYAPSFMALCIADYSRVGFATSSILRWFRSEYVGCKLFDPRLWYGQPLDRISVQIRRDMAAYPPFPRNGDAHWIMRELKQWYFDGFRPFDNQYVALRTAEEKAVLRRFFAFLQDEHAEEFALHEGINGRTTYAAQALLGGNSLPEALGATTPEECRHLVDVLGLLEREFAVHFPQSRTGPIKAALNRHVQH